MICTTCLIEKSDDNFNVKKRCKTMCKACIKVVDKEYRDKKKLENNSIVSEKECFTCKETKCAEKFHKNKVDMSGLSTSCIDCVKKKRKLSKEINIKNNINGSVLTEKKCSKCLETKLIDKFYLSPNDKNGVRSSCIECSKKIDKERRDKNRIKNTGNSNELIEKKCGKCLIVKNANEFGSASTKESGLQSYCNECKKSSEHLEKQRLLNIKRQNIIKDKHINGEYTIVEFKECNTCKITKNKEHYKINLYCKDGIFNSCNECFLQKLKNRRETDINYRFSQNLRCRIRLAILTAKTDKITDTVTLLGTSIENVRNHIESQFIEGMSWDNYGVYKNGIRTWHIDHIKGCANFNLSNPNEQKICFNWKNLQPLWADINISKGSTYDEDDPRLIELYMQDFNIELDV